MSRRSRNPINECVNPSTTQKTFNTGDIELTVRPEALRVINNSLEVIWSDNHHRSVYPAALLAAYTSREAATKYRYNDQQPIMWDAAAITNVPISVDHKMFMEHESTVNTVTQHLTKYGLCFINNCPAGSKAESQLQILAQRIGPLKNTFYGPTWNVRAVESAKNVAYTNVDLDLHMDLLYYESPPGLQFLYCLENQVDGGASVFVDSFTAAEIMRSQYPEEFRILCDYLVDFKYENDGVYYHQARPTFVLNNQTKLLEYVNYSPPFQGIQVSSGFSQYHKAISIFAKLISQDSLRHELVLKEGQCVIFNNRRTLHARKSFGSGKRWLKGAYCDIDAMWSRHRTGERELRA
ncbi:putative Gamma-butyrobetaine hydroxylase subfamily [Taphrina deformans PYCC 5710]|uniref:Gamma-butyrobetaine hydroxylase subfamily n=1 Tax=Taphrina deformans (strain PYCC 5710 / ATCC 11124 / CBS 356.35 / IMI 108563 / JCM 9778 / NBRC 8474) TaxID=1097556 RepID=R4X6H0_TAPDE|nr:putative Gamma-butyrobetaine hydroxylase subfamily [Taphrina deformans PYCC 5710]|eukprot:CCG80709.1 putative Gamma-butyrobetaine hydroxylase subfamily [Taphrina deformans PYCC 5710]